MKKLIILVLFIFILTGCREGEVNDSETTLPNSEPIYHVETIVSLGDLTIIEGYHGDGDWTPFPLGGDAIDIEEAAELGAQYIFDIFGESIDGKYLRLTYANGIRSTQTYWYGEVFPAGIDIPTVLKDTSFELSNNMIFGFKINAVTRERVDIQRNLQGELEQEMETATAEEVEQMMAIAYEYAQKHFTSTRVVGIEDPGSLLTGPVLGFEATDETGRVASIIIIRQTNQLWIIGTSHNDSVSEF